MVSLPLFFGLPKDNSTDIKYVNPIKTVVASPVITTVEATPWGLDTPFRCASERYRADDLVARTVSCTCRGGSPAASEPAESRATDAAPSSPCASSEHDLPESQDRATFPRPDSSPAARRAAVPASTSSASSPAEPAAADAEPRKPAVKHPAACLPA